MGSRSLGYSCKTRSPFGAWVSKSGMSNHAWEKWEDFRNGFNEVAKTTWKASFMYEMAPKTRRQKTQSSLYCGEILDISLKLMQ